MSFVVRYYSIKGRKRLIESGKYKNDQEIKARLDAIYQDLTAKYGTKFVSDYVELEYSAKLVPDGKRCQNEKTLFQERVIRR